MQVVWLSGFFAPFGAYVGNLGPGDLEYIFLMMILRALGLLVGLILRFWRGRSLVEYGILYIS